jgi:hypothetical protein
MPRITIRPVTAADVPTIMTFIVELADYEKLTHEVSATERDLHACLFGPRPVVEGVIATLDEGRSATRSSFPNFRASSQSQVISRGLSCAGCAASASDAGCSVSCGRGRQGMGTVRVGRSRLERAIDCLLRGWARPMHDWTVFRVTGDP